MATDKTKPVQVNLRGEDRILALKLHRKIEAKQGKTSHTAVARLAYRALEREMASA